MNSIGFEIITECDPPTQLTMHHGAEVKLVLPYWSPQKLGLYIYRFFIACAAENAVLLPLSPIWTDLNFKTISSTWIWITCFSYIFPAFLAWCFHCWACPYLQTILKKYTVRRIVARDIKVQFVGNFPIKVVED